MRALGLRGPRAQSTASVEPPQFAGVHCLVVSAMKRAAAIALLMIFAGTVLSPLAASARPMDPAACPRMASQHHHHCDGMATSAADEAVFMAQPPDCPMRCCVTVRTAGVYALSERPALTVLNSARLETVLAERAAFLSETRVRFERGPPRA